MLTDGNSDAEPPADDDVQAAEDSLVLVGPDEVMAHVGWLRAVACSVVGRPRTVRMIDALAAALLEHGDVGGRQVKAICRAATTSFAGGGQPPGSRRPATAAAIGTLGRGPGTPGSRETPVSMTGRGA